MRSKTRYWMPLWGFIVKEIRQTLRDPRMRVVLFVAPVFQLTLFGVALTNEARNIRLAAVFEPRDQVMRMLVEKSLASGWFKPAHVSGPDPFKWIQSGEADAVLVAPKGTLTRETQRNKGNVQLLVNAKNAIRAQSIESYLRSIAQMTAVQEELTEGEGAPLRFDVRAMYNPTFKTSIYMVPGVMSMLVCIATIMLTGMSVAREREMGTLETLISAPIRPIDLVIGKMVPFALLGMLQVPLILTAAVLLFGIPVRGPLYLLIGSAFCFVLVTVSIGLLISTIAANQQQAMLGGFLFLFPAVLLSGLLYPLENMPQVLIWIAQFNPLAHFVGLLRNILLKGGDHDYFFKHAGALAGLAVVCLYIAQKRFRTTA